MRTPTRIPTLALALLAAGIVTGDAVAADGAYEYGSGRARLPEYNAGFRVQAGTAPGISDAEISFAGAANPVEVELDSKQGLGIEAGIYWNTALDGGFGWVVEPTLTFRSVRGESSNGAIREQLDAYGLRLGFGPAVGLGPFVLEATPFVGVGTCYIEDEVSGSFKDTSGAGWTYSYGARVNAFWMFQENLILGVSGGYEFFHAEANFSADTFAKREIALDGSGLVAMGMLGFWF